MATSAAETSRKRLALAMIDFLNSSLTDGTLSPADDRESVEVATSCIADLFKVDPSDTAAVADALGNGQNLLKIYTVYEKLRGKTTASTEGSSSASEARPSTPSTAPGTKNPEAEALKGQGNAAMQKKDYTSAIDFYTKAIDLSPTNAIYLSNRAAAYSGSGDHERAKQDAELAVASDPKYTKAWSRLGLAKFALGDARGSMEAYKQGIESEGNGGSEAMKKGYETAKRKVEEMDGEDDDTSTLRDAPQSPGSAGGMPDLSSLAGMFGGGGAGGGGGMPDFASMMQNPMMQQMAQNLMSNPDMMNNLMSNPRLRELANQYGAGGGGAGGAGGGGGGGMPDLGSLMNDPSIAEMARNFMGGAGRGAGRGGGPPAGSS